MVNYAFQLEYTLISPADESEKLSTTIKLSEVLNAGVRLEASAFSIEAHNAVTALENSGLQLISLYGEGGLCQEAHNAFRFKRIYVKSEQGIPFLSSSDIISLRPETDRYLSRKYTRKLDILAVQKWDVLISRSGTIGNIALANDAFTGKAVSEDVIRLSANDPDVAGFVAAFLRSRYGRPQLTQATYGSVIVHIELEHLKRVQIPDLPPIRRIEIGRLMCKASEVRDEANRLLDEADRLLHERLSLPYLKDIAPTGSASAISKIKASQLMGRLEGSFHDPVAIAAEKQLSELSVGVTTVGDSRVTKEIRAVTKFRKRTYVEKGGIPLLSSKQLFQIDPIDVKGLAKGAHTKDLPEIQLKENMIAVTCSGTIGRVQIIPAYMAKWTANQHATRFLAAEDMNAGYLYAWLASDYGYCLITRNSYGSVILEVDKEMFSSVLIPLPEPKIRDEIGNLVLKANQLRDEAWRNEQDAITRLESWIANKPTVSAQDETNPNKIDLTKITYDPNAIPIWELVAQISAQVPDEEWKKLPTDLARRFDDYQKQRQGQD
ncbi:restriction endonuclease subunit S [Candidatus Synechococcus calcipolaris G9]|uniref:Restriction endonuclease subunit S n=1 Tax=Candidatus Synechococcus calcipolaris G9 TaxID=1497997 RepID=A0ABT6EXS2_9SYNE|nr:restriction endonuclease subunit S [Candidatus Synechococcus calcipolaris]MDG2990599.1 restriction endonuclease subunit S [Candidatus Synechococcus calcipolaris G9]